MKTLVDPARRGACCRPGNVLSGLALLGLATLPRVQNPAPPLVDWVHARRIQIAVRPWGTNGPVGDNYEITTADGQPLIVWRAAANQPAALTYWCHGLTFGRQVAGGTFSPYKYAVPTLLRLGWREIRPAAVHAGDIAVWYGQVWPVHSAVFRVVHPGLVDPPQPDEHRSYLLTKNGQLDEQLTSLAMLNARYGANYRTYTRLDTNP